VRHSAFRSYPFAYHELIVVEVVTLTNEGVGLARYSGVASGDPAGVQGWVVMIPMTLPGDRVKARVYANHKNYSEADLLEVLEPGPGRVVPRCPLYGECGGCQYQHMEYALQLEWKRRHIREVFERLGGGNVEDISWDAVMPSPKVWGYRSKITPHYERPRGGAVREIGFLRRGRRRELVDVEQCPLAMDAINAALPLVRAEVRARAGGDRKGATLLLRAGMEGSLHRDPAAPMIEKVGPWEFEFRAGTFFQNNPFILPELLAYVRSEVEGVGARHLLDAYCGCGLFAVVCGEKFEVVTGVDVNEESILFARHNAERNKMRQCRFHLGKAEAIFASMTSKGSDTCVVLDPPRAGCDRDFLQQLFVFAPRRVVYVSCNPATQMRDVAIFREHGYRPVKLRPFDLFPQTKHLEVVLTLDAPERH
jgi:23S rRNA (uracil1939-C5)-methyltransferase/tRNA (uracil-5-)-methyltransferase